MAGFVKPATPTKGRSNIKPSTPIKSKSSSNLSNCSSVSHSPSTKVVEEINLLLHLETLKRSRENELILKQKIEEAYKLFEERRNRYFNLVAKYATLVKLASTRKVLLCSNFNDLPTESSYLDAKNIKEKLCSGTATDYINSSELNKFKKLLSNMEKYTDLPIRRSELVDLQNATDAIKYSIEAIELSLEKCTMQGLDYFADSLDMTNYPKLLNEYQEKEN